MHSALRRQILIAALIVLAGLTALASGKKKASAAPRMEESKRAQHALQRLTFGPRSGDIERVTAMGVEKWIDLQLHPEKIDEHLGCLCLPCALH